MLDFRKALLALSVAGLGLVGTASAQAPIPMATGLTTTEAYLAAEGTTEQLNQVTITNTGVPTGQVTFLLTSNVNFANQTKSSGQLDVVVNDASCPGPGACPAGSDSFSVTQPGPTTIQIVVTPTAGVSIGSLVVSNLRVNASLAPLSSVVTITLSSVTGEQLAPSGTFSAAAGFVTKSLGIISVNTTATTIPANVSACTLTAKAPGFFSVANISILEGFPDALKAVADSTTGTAPAQGTALAVTFTNLDPSVNYYAPSTITSGTLVLTAETSATSGVPVTAVASPVTTAGSQTPAYVVVTSTAPTVYYVVTTSGGINNSPTIAFTLNASVPSVSAVTTFNTTPVGVSIVLAGAAAPAYYGYSGTITYTGSASSSNATNGVITPCATTLLFPYVTNASGFDTGIAIANASSLPSSSGISTITATSGTCTLTFYGTGSATAAPVTVSYGTVTAGTVGTPIAMGGSSTAAAGLTGYAVAVCNFVGAHGYAFISDSLGGSSGVAANYLAVVLASGADGYAPQGVTSGNLPAVTPTN